MTNDPYRGGSHLPDVTVVTPVHDAHGQLLFFTASRAHHAEFGGITPGSMPPFSRNLAEEGVLIRNFKLVDAGTARWDAFRALLISPPHPTRAIDANLADVAAQVAANHRGAGDLTRLVERYTLDVVSAYMRHIQSAAEQKVRQALTQSGAGTISVSSTTSTTARRSPSRSRSSATVPPSTSPAPAPVSAGNLNANRAIIDRGRDVRAALPARRRHPAQPGRAGPGRDHHSAGPAQSARGEHAPRTARPSWAATSKRRNASSTCCWARSAWRQPARER